MVHIPQQRSPPAPSSIASPVNPKGRRPHRDQAAASLPPRTWPSSDPAGDPVAESLPIPRSAEPCYAPC